MRRWTLSAKRPPAIVRTKRKTTFCALMRSPRSMSLLCLAHRPRERRDDLEHVADDAVIRHLEDRRFLVLVDGDDRLRRSHSGQMLDRARDADGDVQLRTHLSPGLADLVSVGTPAFIGDGTSRSDRGIPKRVSQLLD